MYGPIEAEEPWRRSISAARQGARRVNAETPAGRDTEKEKKGKLVE
jgi:hypothetical protein